MKATTIRSGLILLAAVALTGRSAGAQTNQLYLNSQPGDYIGEGQEVTYTAGDFSASGGGTQAIEVSFSTADFSHWWSLDFAPRQGQVLGPGMYEGATRYPFQSPTHGGLSVDGDGRGCNTLTGRFVVLDASYDVDGNVLSFAADFEQHCDGDTPALYGAIRFNSTLPIVPRLSIGEATVIEGPFGTPVTLTVSLSQPATSEVAVDFATADGTALADSDYVPRSGSVTFLPGQTSRPITLQTLNDGAAEGEQHFYVNLGNPRGAPIAYGQGRASIVDGDGPQTFLILDSQPMDYIGQGLKQKLTVVDGVFAADPDDSPVHVGFTGDTWWDVYFAAPGNAAVVAGTYEGAARWPFQAAGQPGLDVSGDGRGCNTLSGRFVVYEATYDPGGNVLSFAANFEQHCEGPQAPALYGAIRFNSTYPIVPLSGNAGQYQFSAPTYTVSERAAFATITVKRVHSNGVDGSVDYSMDDGTAREAGPNQDYMPRAGTLTFAGKTAAMTFRVPITPDAVHEGNETVLLSLANPQPALEAASLGAQNTAVLTIVDNDPGGKIQFGAAQYSANAASGATTVTLTAKRTGGMASGVTVSYTLTDGTATGGVDYNNDKTSGTLTFASSGVGATSQTLPVAVFPNTTQAKSFTVTLSSPMGGAVLGTPGAATVTILGAQPTLAFTSGAYSVKTTQPKALITVKRSAPLTGTVTVHYATSPGSATNGGGDYTDVAGDLTFAPNVASRTFTVPIAKDALVDASKTVNLALGIPTWTLGTAALDPALGTSVLTILNPNVAPTVQFTAGSYTVNEATPKASIMVKRTGDPVGTATVGYAATGGTATNGGVDYTLTSGTLTFLPSQTVQTFSVPIVNDALDEGTETVQLKLDNPTWSGGTAVVGALGTATLNITDNEPTVQFGAAAYTVSETAKTLLLTVRRMGMLTAPVSVAYDATGGTATRDIGGGGDYALVPGTLSFAAGQAVETFAITLEPDTLADGTKTIELALSNAIGTQLGTPSGTVVTIKDDDLPGKVQFAAAVLSVAETAGAASITVTRTGGSAGLTIHFSTLDTDPGTTAVVGTDYLSASETVSFGSGQKAVTFTIPVLDNGVPEDGAVSIVLGLDLVTSGGGVGFESSPRATLWIVKD